MNFPSFFAVLAMIMTITCLATVPHYDMIIVISANVYSVENKSIYTPVI